MPGLEKNFVNLSSKYLIMIDYISGKIAEATPATAVVDVCGIGYEVNITVIDYAILQSEREVKLYIHEAIREDAHLLYGFLTKKGRELFRLLIGVSGVGPNTARLILSSVTAEDLAAAISMGNDAVLKAVKGVGAKTAQRIIVDLRDKIKGETTTLLSQSLSGTETFEEAMAALTVLGFTRVQSEKALRKIFRSEPTIPVEEAIRKALKML